jgi:cob(I)alamin adenosyltransferase
MNKPLKIYTKTGDNGATSLIGGTRVPKYDVRIEAYGTVDELNSYIGLIRDQQIDNHYRDFLLIIQHKLFAAESLLACDSEEVSKNLPNIVAKDITKLETEIDKMNELLPELHSFIIPGGSTIVSYCHIARCVCRRAERLTTKIASEYSVDLVVLKYLNRLSDYLFVLARKIAFDKGVPETLWNHGI